MKTLLLVTSCLILTGTTMAEDPTPVAGTLSPAGPPASAPVRAAAGPSCIVDLTQRYEMAGDLAGQMEIAYRILVHGPCGAPAGTYDEEWIARGTFEGKLGDAATSATFVYTAEVRDEGAVRGTMTFGGELQGELTMRGRFSDRELRYSGDLARSDQRP